MKPQSRVENLLVHEVGDEIVVYDRVRREAHRLNATSATVWKKLDGETSIEAIAADLEVDRGVVDSAVDQLAQSNLIITSSFSRRAAVKRVAAAAAVGLLLPTVASIAAPTPAMANSDPLGGGTPI